MVYSPDTTYIDLGAILNDPYYGDEPFIVTIGSFVSVFVKVIIDMSVYEPGKELYC